MPQLVLGQIEEKVGLVFVRIVSPPNVIASPVILPHRRIMPGRYPTCPKLLRPLPQRHKFEMTVALHTGVRGRALTVGIHKVVDNVLRKLGLKVDHIERNTKGCCHASGIRDVIQRTAGFMPRGGRLWPVPQLHGDTNHLIALLVQQGGADRAIHTTTHGHHDTLSHVVFPPGYATLTAPRSHPSQGALGRQRRVTAAYCRSAGSSTKGVRAPWGGPHGAPYAAR